MADDLSLAPLQITPGMMPAAPPPPTAQPDMSGDVSSLQAMFPDMDVGVLQVVLGDCDGDVERAIETLLEMTGQGGSVGFGGDGGGGGGGGGDLPAGLINEDEELAKSLFLEFATQLEKELKVKVPDEVRQDPELYQAFMASALADHEARSASSGGGRGQVDQLATRVFSSSNAPRAPAASSGSSGGVASFLDRFRGKAKTTPMMSSTRVKVIAVGDDKNEGMKASLLDNADKV